MTENERKIEKLKLENKKLRKALTNLEVRAKAMQIGNTKQNEIISALKAENEELKRMLL